MWHRCKLAQWHTCMATARQPRILPYAAAVAALVCAAVLLGMTWEEVFMRFAGTPPSPPSHAAMATVERRSNATLPRDWIKGEDAAGVEPDVDFASCYAHCRARNRPSPMRVVNASCTTEAWCDAFYTDAIVHDACEVICATQFPPDCSRARFLVMTKEHPTGGLGSNLHLRLIFVVAAISTQRVFVVSPAHVSPWTFANDSFAPCARRRADCYWLPTTHCTLPENWADLSDPTARLTSPAQFVRAVTDLYVGPFSEKSTPKTAKKSLAGLSVAWWFAQLASFMYRPNAHLTRTVLQPIAARVFPKPVRFMSVFIRAGDKYRETKLFPVDVYFEHARRIAALHGLENIFLASDSALALNGFLALNRQHPEAGLEVRYINYSRIDKGLRFDTLRATMWNRSAVRELVDVGQADLYVTRHATVSLGTLTSNWCRMQLELRNGNGMYGHQFYSLDAWRDAYN